MRWGWPVPPKLNENEMTDSSWWIAYAMAPVSMIIMVVTWWRCPDRSLPSIWHRLWSPLPPACLFYPLLLIRNLQPVMCDAIFSHSDSMCFDFSVQLRECQAINPNSARLQFQLSRCWAAHWITLKSWREPCVVKTLRQKDRQETDCVGLEETHILLAERCLSIRGENSVIRNAHRWMKLPHWLFGISSLLSFSFVFGSILMHSLPNLAVERKGYRESCWACVHGWELCEMTVTKEDAH